MRGCLEDVVVLVLLLNGGGGVSLETSAAGLSETRKCVRNKKVY